MKEAIGIVREIDHVSRVCIPMEYLRSLGWERGMAVEILAQADGIFMRKYHPNDEANIWIETARNIVEQNYKGEYKAEVLTLLGSALQLLSD